MQQLSIAFVFAAARRVRLVLLGLGLAAGPAWAQENCLLVPAPLAERLSRAVWVVEAEVKADAPQVVPDAQGHLFTRYGLTVFKVFRGPAGAGADLPPAVLLPGGTLGNRREEVSSTPQLTAGQQGVFFLVPDARHSGGWRLYAGPQGLISYDVAGHRATEPFAAYADIETSLYAALRDPGEALGYRSVRTNAALSAPRPVRRPGGVAVVGITGFTPTTLTAGTGAVLTISGSGFSATRGTGVVRFRSANTADATVRVQPLDSDYVSWSDTEIQVRVPSATLERPPAGSGTVQVTNSASEESTSTGTLTIQYALTNLRDGNAAQARRPRLTNDNAAGGYTLAYSTNFQANASAVAAFERANAQWVCQTSANRVTTSPATDPATLVARDNINIITFSGPPSVPENVLGIAFSYYNICPTTVPVFTLEETDFAFASTISPSRPDLTFNFSSDPPTTSQFDFQSVALHELGHGIQLNHVINSAAVMHFSISNGQTKRTLGTSDDIAGGRNVVSFSASPAATACGTPAHVALARPAGCTPTSLPVELTAFAARYEAGRGTELSWSTATERNSAYFALEARDEGIAAWAELRRQPAAGLSSTPRHYRARDPRLLSGRRYYRLRQVDEDGQTSFSPVVAVAATEAGLALYPNPATDWLEVSGPPARAGQLRFYDLTAREAVRFELAPGVGKVNVGQLPAGLYFVEWTDGQTVRRGRVQKQ